MCDTWLYRTLYQFLPESQTYLNIIWPWNCSLWQNVKHYEAMTCYQRCDSHKCQWTPNSFKHANPFPFFSQDSLFKVFYYCQLTWQYNYLYHLFISLICQQLKWVSFNVLFNAFLTPPLFFGPALAQTNTVDN